MAGQTVTVSDTTRFHVAAAVLGDATAWDRIAALNGLADPSITGTATLVLPVPAALLPSSSSS